jgi:peptidyl-prolyl cis-trans isomerase C
MLGKTQNAPRLLTFARGEMLGNSMPWILLLSLWLLACNRTNDPAVSKHDSILAEVNDTHITVNQFQQKWSQLPPPLQKAYSGPGGKKDFLNELITRELLLQKAHKMELDRNPALGDRVEEYRQRLLLDATLRELVNKKINVSEDEIKAYFDSHRDALPAIEEARAAHILVRTEPEAQALLAKLRRGADFAALAKAHSIDSGSKDKGGDLGVIRKGQVIPEIEAVVFQLKPGQTSEIVKTPYGYQIIRVKSRRVRKPRDVDDVKNELRIRIESEKESALFEEVVKSLKAESKIVVSDTVLASIGENVSPNPDPAAIVPH